MNKLKLDLEDLQVTTFVTHEAADEAGTVQGHAAREAEGPADAYARATAYVTCIVYMTGCSVCNCPTAVPSCIVYMTGCSVCNCNVDTAAAPNCYEDTV